MQINIKELGIEGDKFAYDGCHKIYILEDATDEHEVIGLDAGYAIYPIEELQRIWEASCSLKFISNYKLTEHYVRQGQEEEE